jgi:hypothetical protein
MKRYILLFACLLSACITLPAQTVDTTVCDILANPQSFDGKIVRIKGTVIAGLDEFAIKDASCHQPIHAIWLAYPTGTAGKAGPAVVLQLQLAKNSTGTAVAPDRKPVQLDKNKDFKQFDSLLATPYKSGALCLGCGKFTVTATLTGRLDGSKETGATKDATGKFVTVSGFGNMNLYTARLVLQSVADVVPQEIDYSKAAAAKGSGDDGSDMSMSSAVQAFPAGTPAAQQLKQDFDAFGAPNEENGVNIAFGGANEVPKVDGGKSNGSSPDGLLLNCVFAPDVMKKKPLGSIVMTHVGDHIATVRSSNGPVNAYDAETHAWQSTVLISMAMRQKSLVLPGGYVAWSTAWPANDRNGPMAEAISSFLTGWAPYTK